MGNMTQNFNFRHTTRQFFILLIGLVCLGILTLSVSAVPPPAPEVTGTGVTHLSVNLSVNNTTPIDQVPVSSKDLDIHSNDFIASSSSGKITVSAMNKTSNSTVQWQECLGGTDSDGANFLIRTSDGGYIFSGYTNSTDGNVTGMHGYFDYWIVKFAANGTMEWQKCLGGSDGDIGESVIQTSDTGYLITGYSYSTDGDVKGNHGYDDSWNVKLSRNGSIEWSNSLGGSLYDWGWSANQTADGGYLIAGGTGSTDGNVSGNHGAIDLWIQKLAGNGTLQWQKCLGGTEDEWANSILQTTEGRYMVAGFTNSTDGDITFNHGKSDAWVVNLTSTGALDWQKTYGGNGTDLVNAMIKTADGGYLLGGYTDSNDGNVSGNHGDYDAWIVKLDSDGNLKWQKCLGGTGEDGAESVSQTSDGEYMIAGYTSSNNGDVSGNHGDYDAWIVKLDSDGNLKWQKCLGGTSDDDAKSVIQVADNTYMITGYTNSNNGDVSGNHGDYDAWVVDVRGDTSEKPTELVNMATLLSQPGPNGGTSMLGKVSDWTLNTLGANNTNSISTPVTSNETKVSFTVNATKGFAPLTVAFTSACQGNPISYLWNFGDGTTSGEQDPVHTYTVPGTYSITLKVMNTKSGALGILPNSITVTDNRQFAKKYAAPGTA